MVDRKRKRLPAEVTAGGATEVTAVSVAPAPSSSSFSVFVLGGQQVFRGGPVSAVLRRSTKGAWEEDSVLAEQRTAPGAALFNDGLVVVGGAGTGPTPANRKATVEVLPLSAVGAKGRQATLKAPALTSPRMAPGVAVAGNALWAVGGCNGKRVLKTTEFLLPGAGAWAPGPDLPMHGRFGSATVAAGPNLIITCGGRGGGDVMLRSADVLRVVSGAALF